MSKNYLINSRVGTKELFEKRIRYTVDASIGRPKNLVDFNNGEKIFYGRMDAYELPVSLMDESNLKSTSRSVEPSSPQSAMRFVIAAFEAMAANFDKAAMHGKISADEKFLSSLRVYKGYESPWHIYQKDYKRLYFSRIADQFKNELNLSNEIKNMDTFIEILIKYLPPIVQNLPITYPAYVKSKFCDVMKTGLALELSDLNYSDDRSKIEHFIDNKNWGYYVNACNAYGFMIDKKYPWRIVADINSNFMKQLAVTHHIFGGPIILNTVYTSCIKTYMGTFIKDLIELYDLCKLRRYTEHYQCSKTGIDKKRSFFPRNYTTSNFFEESIITSQRVIHLYMIIRLAEQQPNLTEVEKQALIKDCLRLMAIKRSFALSISLFELMIASTFDKSGSFSYNIKKYKAIMLDAFERGNIQSFNIGPSRAGTSAAGGGVGGGGY